MPKEMNRESLQKYWYLICVFECVVGGDEFVYAQWTMWKAQISTDN